MNSGRKILEGIVTTCNEDGTTNIAPMGPHVDDAFTRLRLRPFPTSRTLSNLRRHGEGVFHVTDDVELLARTALNQLEQVPELISAPSIRGRILADACRWYCFRVESLDERGPRVEMVARVVERGVQREFFGFNRAKHAVVEAAILATRIEFLPRDEILDAMARLAKPVEKTAGDQERRAFQFLKEYVTSRF